MIYHHRWWFPEDGYRSITFGSFVTGVVTGSLPAKWLRFVITHIHPDEVVAIGGEVLYPLGGATPG
ncbi:hypothetical protein D3C83_128400 [compost metagenome]